MIKKPKCLQHSLKIEAINKTLDRRQAESNQSGVNIASSRSTKKRMVGSSTPISNQEGRGSKVAIARGSNNDIIERRRRCTLSRTRKKEGNMSVNG
jgi:hypothetical protein